VHNPTKLFPPCLVIWVSNELRHSGSGMIVMVVISATSILQYHFDFVKSYLETARNNTMQPCLVANLYSTLHNSTFIQYASNPNDIFIKLINPTISQSCSQSIDRSIDPSIYPPIHPSINQSLYLSKKDPKAVHTRRKIKRTKFF